MNDDIGNELTELSREVNPVDMTERAYTGARRLGLRRAVLGVAVVAALMGGGVAGAVTLWPTGTTQQPGDGGGEECATEEPAEDGTEEPPTDAGDGDGQEDVYTYEKQPMDAGDGDGQEDPNGEPEDPGEDPDCDPMDEPAEDGDGEAEPTCDGETGPDCDPVDEPAEDGDGEPIEDDGGGAPADESTDEPMSEE